MGSVPLGGDVAESQKNKSPPLMYYHFKFGSSASKDVCIKRRNPKNWAALELCSIGIGYVDDAKIHAPYPRVTT